MRQVVIRLLIRTKRSRTQKGHSLVEYAGVADGADIPACGIREPEEVIGEVRANASAPGRMPPMLHVPLAKLTAGGTKKYWWRCKHGHEWQTTIGLRVHSGTGCPKCGHQTSRIEIAVYSELSALFNDVAWREKIAGYECDIFLRESRIGIEIDGVFWHRRPEVELAKSAAFEAEGVQPFEPRAGGRTHEDFFADNDGR